MVNKGENVCLKTKKKAYIGVVEHSGKCLQHGDTIFLREGSKLHLFRRGDVESMEIVTMPHGDASEMQTTITPMDASVTAEDRSDSEADIQEEMQGNADAPLCARVEEESDKNEKAMRDQSQQIANAPTNFMSNELNATSKETIQKEFAPNSPAVSRTKETVNSASSVAQASRHELLESKIAPAGPTGSNHLVTQQSTGSLDARMKKVSATATTNPSDADIQEEMQGSSDALCARVQEESDKNEKALRDQSQQIANAPTNFMSNELNATSKETIQKEFAPNSPAVSRTKETVTSASSVAQASRHELLESKIAPAGPTGSNHLVTQQSTGSLDARMKKVSATATTNPSDASSSFFQFPTWQPPQQSMRTPVGDEAPPPQGYTSKAYSLWPPGTSHGDGKLYGGYAHGYDVGYDDGYAAGYSDMQSRATGNGVAYSSVPSSSNYPSNPCYPGVRQPSSFPAYGSTQGYYQDNLYGSTTSDNAYFHGNEDNNADGYWQRRATGSGVAYSSVPSSSNYPSNPCYPGVRQPSSFTAYDPSQGLDVIRRGPRNHGTENQKTILEKKAK